MAWKPSNLHSSLGRSATSGKRWGASLLSSFAVHAVGVGLLAGVVYEVTARPEGPATVADVAMTLRTGSVQDFVRMPQNAVAPVSSVLQNMPAGAGVSGQGVPDLMTILNQLREQSGSGAVSALGVLTESSNSVLAGSAALAPNAGSNGQGGAGGASISSVAFAGLTATGEQARSIVYVVDASGPMVSTMPAVFAELMRSVDSLQPTQKFSVVLFRQTTDGRTLVFSPNLVDATAVNRTALRAWLGQINAAGRSNPVDGLRQGLSMRPQAIFLLSRSIPRASGNPWDAEAGGPDGILRELENLNPGTPGARPTVIKTIQFLEPDPTGVMERIGRLHGGASDAANPPFRVLRREELQRR
ncbi:MAG: hypothetical protein MUE97_06915 [Phycisphaerales bacterium]|jgi:hypothetical protein|nr:hypothetical protein [Phycisphaerales bacterium]